MAFSEKARQYSPIVVRYAVGIVFLLLGIDQIIDPAGWTGYLPLDIVSALPFHLTATQFMFYNGLFDTLIGLLLLAGIFVRIVSAVAVLHLLGVIVTLGYNDLAIRDIGLLLASFSVFLHGPDRWCLKK
ncbi:MAG TPA: DoxX family membrane protein [Candidatus Nanoarchaeia archaeon]|nr:DoxX family membrane protein [Candidatus Nanoarchaeia archaeon]